MTCSYLIGVTKEARELLEERRFPKWARVNILMRHILGIRNDGLPDRRLRKKCPICKNEELEVRR